jgi:hypothetical protein
LSGTTISACTAGPDDPACEPPESPAPGRIGPGGACAAAPPGNIAHAPHKITPTATVLAKLQIGLLVVLKVLLNVRITFIVVLILALCIIGAHNCTAAVWLAATNSSASPLRMQKNLTGM